MSRMLTDMPWFGDLTRREPLLGGPDPPGRHPGLRRLVPARGRRRRARRHRGRGLRCRPADPDRRDHPGADRRPGAAGHRGRRVARRRRSSTRPTRRPCTPPCSATPARSPSPPPRSTPAPPRPAARGTPGSRPWWSTRCCAPRPTRPSPRGPAPWAGPHRGGVTVVLGSVPAPRSEDLFDQVRRAARAAGMDALCATQGERLVVILGGVGGHRQGRPRGRRASSATARSWSVRAPTTSPRPTSPPAPRCPGSGPPSAGPTRPGPVASDDLLPERVLAGDGHARRHLVEEVYVPLRRRPGDTLIDTLTAYFQHGQSLEATARALFVHPNTVRYRLRQAADADRAVGHRRPGGADPPAGAGAGAPGASTTGDPDAPTVL